jgi:signal transduction histidine kinase
MGSPLRPKPLLLLLSPYLLLALLFAATELLAMHRVSQLRAGVEDIEQDMLTDIDLASRMRVDMEDIRLLTNRHILEKERSPKKALDARIAIAEADYASAAAEYESMPMLPDEEGPWQSLKSVAGEIPPRIHAVLALSRNNDDDAALRDLAALQGDFDRANGDLRSITELNRRSAREAVGRASALERSATLSLQSLAFGGVVLLVVLGVAMTRVLRRRNAQLHDYADKLQVSNRELDAFAGRVAHDLRGALTTAHLVASRLSKQSPRPDQVKSFEALQRSLGRMGGIIQDLLAMARLETSGSVGVCNPAAAVAQLRDELASRAEQCDASLVIDVASANVRCKEGLLAQVIWNLTDNALKYRRAEVRSYIEVCGRAAADGYELRVRDNGVGIPRADTARVFEPLYRADSGTTSPGTGIGLSIVKRAVETSGGTVSVTSEIGRGSMFVARLPLAGR